MSLGRSEATEQRDALDLQDRVDDLLAGLAWWRDHKVAAAELTTADEMLIRWVEHNERDAA